MSDHFVPSVGYRIRVLATETSQSEAYICMVFKDIQNKMVLYHLNIRMHLMMHLRREKLATKYKPGGAYLADKISPGVTGCALAM